MSPLEFLTLVEAIPLGLAFLLWLAGLVVLAAGALRSRRWPPLAAMAVHLIAGLAIPLCAYFEIDRFCQRFGASELAPRMVLMIGWTWALGAAALLGAAILLVSSARVESKE